jgi:hypothetical protein
MPGAIVQTGAFTHKAYVSAHASFATTGYTYGIVEAGLCFCVTFRSPIPKAANSLVDRIPLVRN